MRCSEGHEGDNMAEPHSYSHHYRKTNGLLFLLQDVTEALQRSWRDGARAEMQLFKKKKYITAAWGYERHRHGAHDNL